jgi:DNA-binding protein HU-beta
VPRKNPIGKIKDAATGAAVTVVGTVSETVKDPIGTGQKVVGTAVGQAVAVAGLVGTRLPHRKRAAAPKVESRPVAEPQSEPRKDQGDPVAPAKEAAAKKAPAKKAAAKKAPAKKAAAKKAPAKKAPAKKAPAKKTAAKKAPATKAPANKAPAAKAPATKAPANKAPANKAPATKAPATKAPAKKAADLATVEDSSVETPVGTTGADPATNPDTTESDLQQPGTAPLMDPSLTNQVKSEAETAARAADVEKG